MDQPTIGYSTTKKDLANSIARHASNYSLLNGASSGGDVGSRAVRWRWMQSWPWHAHEQGRSRAVEHGDWAEAVCEEREGYGLYLYYFFHFKNYPLSILFFQSALRLSFRLQYSVG
jgi:hypothetical protein